MSSTQVKVAVVTSVSANVAELSALTTPNKLEYCLRHGYSLVCDNQPYEEAARNTHYLCDYLDRFDLLWTLDCDAIITNMAQQIEDVPSLGPHVTVCEEGIVEWNGINCGSMIWKNTTPSRGLLHAIATREDEWSGLPCIWQTWLQNIKTVPEDLITVAPLRAFNSCVWNRPANARDEIGGHWQPGDFVYHACGVFPADERVRWLRDALSYVRR
jgi:hypothetical protein